jgi:DNA-binding transcriptional LysR family regulator
MQLSSRQLEAFVAVARALNFTRAAERLGLTQSALSQRIRKLEEELGAALLVRAPGAVRLTETGSRILRYCEAKEALEAEIKADLATSRTGEMAGVIRVAGHLSVLRPIALPALAPLLREHPRVQCELLTAELKSLPGMLKRGEADLVILDQELPWAALQRLRLGEETYVAVESADHATRSEVWLDINPDDQVTERFFQFQGETPSYRRSFMSDVYGIIDGVALGIGRAVVPRHMLTGRTDIRVLPEYRAQQAEVWLHHYTLPFYSRLQQAVVTQLRKTFRTVLAGA